MDLLVVENFDEEQIWQELELQNTAVLTHFEDAVSKAVTDDTLTLLEGSEEEEDEDEDVGDGLDDDDEQQQEEDEEEEGGDKRKNGLKPKSDGVEELYEEDSDIDFDVDELEKQSKQQRKMETKTPKFRTVSEVDDQFFKLSEMEAFLDDMDKREGKEPAGEEIDYFHDLPSDEDDELVFDKPATSKNKKKVRCSN